MKNCTHCRFTRYLIILLSASWLTPDVFGFASVPGSRVRRQCFASLRKEPVSRSHFNRSRVRRQPCDGNMVPSFLQVSMSNNPVKSSEGETPSLLRDYITMMRPVTIVQAVGALIVGRLVLLSSSFQDPSSSIPRLAAAAASVYLSYGSGMAMNDCSDAAVDSQHEEKSDRAVASGRISTAAGWCFCAALSVASLGLARVADAGVGRFGFVAWTASNLALMVGYALGLQRIFLVKNIVCGYLAMSPLVGATLLDGGGHISTASSAVTKLYRLAGIGFSLQLSREILKDAEDVDVDRGVKMTLPLVVGTKASERIAFGLVAIVIGVMVLSPHYWEMFASKPPVYALSVICGVPMCLRASVLPLMKGQRLLKKSIYVLLAGMISGLLLQK